MLNLIYTKTVLKGSISLHRGRAGSAQVSHVSSYTCRAAGLSFFFPAPSPRSQRHHFDSFLKMGSGLELTSCSRYLGKTVNPLEQKRPRADPRTLHLRPFSEHGQSFHSVKIYGARCVPRAVGDRRETGECPLARIFLSSCGQAADTYL